MENGFRLDTTTSMYAYHLKLDGTNAASLRADEAGYQFEAGMAVRYVQNADAK